MFREQMSDEKYQLRVDRWNKHDDNTLLTFLLVDYKLIMEENHAFKNRNKHFLAAIASLQKISEKNTPDEKLEVITTMYHDICSSSTAVVWSMDALLPVTMYVVVRARVPQLGAELAELEELMEPHLCQVIDVNNTVKDTLLVRMEISSLLYLPISRHIYFCTFIQAAA